jgi:ABC-2 type transport system ATP-binding protein
VAVFGAGLHITVDDPEETPRRIRQVLEHNGIELLRMELISPSMEDLFVSLVEAEERKPQ